MQQGSADGCRSMQAESRILRIRRMEKNSEETFDYINRTDSSR